MQRILLIESAIALIEAPALTLLGRELGLRWRGRRGRVAPATGETGRADANIVTPDRDGTAWGPGQPVNAASST